MKREWYHFPHSIQMGMCLSNFNIFLYEYITIQAQRQTWIFEYIKKLLTIPGREASLSITITSIFVECIVTFEYYYGEYFLEILLNKTFISLDMFFYVCCYWFWRSEEIKMCYYHGKTIRNKKEVKSSNTP